MSYIPTPGTREHHTDLSTVYWYWDERRPKSETLKHGGPPRDPRREPDIMNAGTWEHIAKHLYSGE